MKLVIDIPEEAYHMICETTFTEDTDRMFLQAPEDRLKTLLLFKTLDSIKEGKAYAESFKYKIDNVSDIDFEGLSSVINCQIRHENNGCNDCELSCPRNELISILSKLRPTGQWIPVNPDSRGYTEIFECSCCKERIYRDHCMKRNDYPNCPYCLADIKI